MKRFKFFIFGVSLSSILLVFCFNTGSADQNTLYRKILKNIYQSLTILHYQIKPIDDNFSKSAFTEYLEQLDPSKRFFMQSQIDSLKVYQTEIDDAFKNQDLSFYNKSISSYNYAITHAEKTIDVILSQPLNINEDETIILDEKKLSYAQSDKEYHTIWKKNIKLLLIGEMYTLKQDTLNVSKSVSELQQLALTQIKENTQTLFQVLKKRKNMDWFSVYCNALTAQYDPHTNYFSPKDKEDFDFSISGQFEGIGATLKEKKGYALIEKLIVGGPAWKSKNLEKGDIILKVGQGSEEPVNIVGMLLDESIRLIRGKKGTNVRLIIKKPDGQIKEVIITRDIIEYEETFAKSAIIEKDNIKFGYIHLPEFYMSTQDKNGRNCSNDVAKAIESLKKSGTKALVLDLRSNGGGSLDEVVKMTGQFIDQGPVVQVRKNQKDMNVMNDPAKGILWNGPMVVLVNELSASASEILAAALQDYGRAIIIGSLKTYGKGTVQTIMPLDRFSLSDNQMGAVKLTIQKFYRINGASTQQKGVIPDIIIPSRYAYAKISESEEKQALAWDQTRTLGYQKWSGSKKITQVALKQQQLISKNPMTKTFDQLALMQSKSEQPTIQSLNYQTFIKNMDDKKSSIKSLEPNEKYNNHLTLNPLNNNKEWVNDSVSIEKNKQWNKDVQSDFVIETAINTLKLLL